MARVKDKDVRDALQPILSTAFGASTRVVKRWKMAFEEADWKAALRSVSTAENTDGWIYARTAIQTESTGMPGQRYDAYWKYVLWYFRTIDEGTSEYEINEKLDNLIQALEDDPQMGLDPATGFYGHTGLQVTNIDTIEDRFHFVTAELSVLVTFTRGQ